MGASRFRGLVEPVERLLAWVAVRAHARPAPVLALAFALTAVMGWQARSLRMDTDLTHLLPKSFESVQALERYNERSYGVGYVSVVLQGGTTEARRKLAHDLAPKLTALPSIEYVDLKRPTEFFSDRGLYFLEKKDLETIEDRIEKRRQWEVRKRSPLYDLGLEPLGDPPPLTFDDLIDKYEGVAARAGADLDEDDEASAGYLEDEEAGMLVVLARPTRRSTDIGFNDQVVADVADTVKAIDTEAFDPGISVALSGRYKKKTDQKKQIESDLQLASMLALGLMLGFLGLHFRRLSAIGLVLGPLLLGLVWAFGLAAALFGSLNMLTGFIGALLLGVGVDHGIHLLARVHEEAAKDEPEKAVERAFGNTGRAVVAAALTTLFAFAGVAISEFRAFREFGIIAASGLAFVVLAYTTVLPALLSFGRGLSSARGVPPSPFARALPRWAPWAGWGAALALMAALPFARDAEFDYDFASLEDSDLPAFQLDRKINRLLGRSQTPLVVLADGPEQERAIVAALRTTMDAQGEASTIQQVLSLEDLVPEDAEAKAELIAAIGQSVEGTKAEWLDEDQRSRRARILEMTKAQPFGRADLPMEVRRELLARNGQGSFVLVYPRVSLSDGDGVRRLAEELRSTTLADGSRLDVAGEAMILADVLDMVVTETPIILGFTMALVVVVLLLLLGPTMVVPCCLVAGTTLSVTFGLMPTLGVKVNYLNLIIVPVLFGMAVDGAVHMLIRYRETGDVVVVTEETGRAVAGAILTTILGFGAFLMAHHPGLHSLGELAVLGLAVNLVVCLVALPAILLLAQRTRQLREEQGATRMWTRLAVTVGLAGDAPLAPGTLGALTAIPIGVAAQAAGLVPSLVIAAVVSAASIPVTAAYLRHKGDAKDPQEVVLDELAGCLIAIVMVPFGFAWVIAAFAFFRLFDILKPWPVGWIDRRAPGAWGVVGDDLVAGLLAGMVLLGVHYAGLTMGWWAA